MTEPRTVADHEWMAEAAYAAMYDARPHDVKDLFEDACTRYHHAIEAARSAGLADDVARLTLRLRSVEAVYDHQFRGVGR